MANPTMEYKVFKDIEATDIPSVLQEYGTLSQYGEMGETLLDIVPGTTRLPNTLTTRYGYGSFPYHTDTAYWHKPANYVILYCKNPGSGNRNTHLVNIEQLIQYLDLKNLFHDAIYLVKRNFKSFYARPVFKIGSEVGYRFDRDCMIPQNSSAFKLNEILLSIDETSLPFEYDWKKGDLLIFNNYRLLHSRGHSEVEDNDRILTRGLIL